MSSPINNAIDLIKNTNAVCDYKGCKNPVEVMVMTWDISVDHRYIRMLCNKHKHLSKLIQNNIDTLLHLTA